MKCLVIEHDHQTLRYICRALQEALYRVTACDNGLDALHYITRDSWDLLIIDQLLPGGVDGLALVRKLRKTDKTTSVVVVGALADAEGRVRCLRAGADGYVAKPFKRSELMAQVEALSRRQPATYHLPLLQVADLTLDTRSFRVARGATPIVLQPGEFRLLAYLMRHEYEVVTRAMLLEGVWGGRENFTSKVIDVQVTRLRSKIDKGFAPALIQTIRGVGYLLGKPSGRTVERVVP